MTAPVQPFLSLVIIVGDDGVKTLPRLLKSVLERATGPLVDEIVIGWNGKDDGAFRQAMGDGLGGLEEGKVNEGALSNGVLVRVTKFSWPGRFDTARNIVWPLARGEWVMWLDADDIVSDGGAPGRDNLDAILQYEKDYGLPPLPANAPPSPTLKEVLRGFPWDVNCLIAPYDYTIDENGYALVRQKMKRVVRRNAGFFWHSPEASGIHEVLTPMGGITEKAIQTGFLVRHYPVVSDADRAKRNRDIINAMVKEPTETSIVTARQQYDLANAQMTQGEGEKADQSLRAAIVNSLNDMDRYIYRLSRASLCARMSNYEGTLGEAFAAMALLPDIQDAYFLAAEAYYALGKWQEVINWGQRGMEKKPTMLAVDRPLYRVVQPLVQMAMAHGNLNNPEVGLPLARQALERYPGNTLAEEAIRVLDTAARKKQAVSGLLDLTDFFVRAGRMLDAFALMNSQFPPLRGIEALPRYRALRQQVNDWVKEKGLDYVQPTDVPEVLSQEPDTVIQELVVQDGVVKTRQSLGPKVLDVGIYCPHAVEEWVPSSIHQKGLGGSESSVYHLARELALLNVRVTTYTPGGPLYPSDIHDGIIELGIDAASTDALNAHDVVVCHRAPWMARRDDLKKPLWVWHQDNGYGNPWTWSPEVDARIALNLHVSTWAMCGLLDECYPPGRRADAPRARHVVLGNGIDPSVLDDDLNERPLRAIFCSDPSRGLAPLLDAWPTVRKDLPTAELHVYTSFRVSLALTQAQPGAGFNELRALELKLAQMGNDPASGVKHMQWQKQADVVAAMKQARVYCYPGGPMPEGYGVALVQAQAAGCFILAPRAGALPEVLDESRVLWISDAGQTPSPYSATHLGHLISDVLTREGKTPPPRFEKHLWPNVAKRFMKLWEEQNGPLHGK